MHPLGPDFTVMKDDELQKKYNELYQTYLIAHRQGNYHIINQIQMLLEDYKQEIGNRQQKLLEENNDKHKINDLIRIKKNG